MAGDEEARARATLVEMQVRLSQGPHIALGVAEISTPEQVRAAFLELTKQYHPARFGRLSPELQKMSNEVFLGIKSAHESLMRMMGSSLRPRAAGTHQSAGVPLVADATGSSSVRQSQQVGTVRSTSQIPAMRTTGPMQTPAPPPQPATQPPGRAQTPTGRDRVSSQSQPIQRVTPALGIPIQRPASGAPPVRQTPPLGVNVPRTQTPSRPPPTRPVTPTQRPGTPQPRAQTPPRAGEVDPGTLRYSGTPAPAPQQPRAAQEFDEHAALSDALALLNKRDWTAARHALHALAARVPQSRPYRALLCYSRGREAFAAGRPDDAAMEYQRALQLDPELASAKQALAEIKRR